MRHAGLIGLSLLWIALVAAAADEEKSLVVENKYAWPRERQIVLDGSWQLASGDPAQPVTELPDLKALEWFDVTVPTEVHWALFQAGKVPHPYKGLNIKKQRWVEDKAWWFRRTFTVPKEFRGENMRLIFEGVDYYGRYWLNGRYVGASEGAFGAVKINVGGLRTDQPNELIVRVDCGGYKIGGKGGSAPCLSGEIGNLVGLAGRCRGLQYDRYLAAGAAGGK